MLEVFNVFFGCKNRWIGIENSKKDIELFLFFFFEVVLFGYNLSSKDEIFIDLMMCYGVEYEYRIIVFFGSEGKE